MVPAFFFVPIVHPYTPFLTMYVCEQHLKICVNDWLPFDTFETVRTYRYVSICSQDREEVEME